MENLSFFDRISRWARTSVSLKLFVIGFLILILLIPVSFLSSLIYERENLRDQAVREVSSKWGGPQTITGPVLSVPYESTRQTDKGETIITDQGYVHFLPDELAMDGVIDPQKRYRGIYVVVLYNAKLSIEAKFSALNVDALSVPEADIQWENALFRIGISDMSGIQSDIPVTINDTTYALGPGTISNDLMTSGGNFKLDLRQRPENMNFTFDLDVNGSTDLYVAPFGKTTRLNLQSTWPDPSFGGTFLPDERTVNADGFNAIWSVLQLNRNYPQQGKQGFIANYTADNYNNNYEMNDAATRNSVEAFGVKLLLPIDEYQKTMRSAKYATLFILVTFLTFFFIEVLNRKRLHPIQYLLVGSAIILFYILLLSISEHLSFNWSYLIGCLIILALVSVYCSYVLKNRKLTLMVTGILALLYAFFYSLLQLQDYALLLGSIGLLIILASIMYLTRNIDWYNIQRVEDEQ